MQWWCFVNWINLHRDIVINVKHIWFFSRQLHFLIILFLFFICCNPCCFSWYQIIFRGFSFVGGWGGFLFIICFFLIIFYGDVFQICVFCYCCCCTWSCWSCCSCCGCLVDSLVLGEYAKYYFIWALGCGSVHSYILFVGCFLNKIAPFCFISLFFFDDIGEIFFHSSIISLHQTLGLWCSWRTMNKLYVVRCTKCSHFFIFKFSPIVSM